MIFSISYLLENQILSKFTFPGYWYNHETVSIASRLYRIAGELLLANNVPDDNDSSVCRRYLRETLKMANAEDLNRLTSCSLVLLGHIFLSINNSRESMNMVTPAMQLASKIPDVHVQLWASAILKGNIRLTDLYYIHFFQDSLTREWWWQGELDDAQKSLCSVEYV